MNVFVDNVTTEITNDDLRTIFEPHGHVASVTLIVDEHDDGPRGFGIVDMPDEKEARSAIESLHETDFMGKKLILMDRRALKNRREKADRRLAGRNDSGDRRTPRGRREADNHKS